MVFIVLSNLITVNVRFRFNILISVVLFLLKLDINNYCGENCELKAAKICNEKRKSQVVNGKECRFTILSNHGGKI